MPCPPDESSGTSLRCFGVGDGWPSADRRHSAYLYRLGSTTLLVDCGDGLSSTYKASGLSYDAVDAILISHLHSDHVGGLSMFLQSLWLERRTKPLTICAPAGGIAALRAWLEATLVPPDLFAFELRWQPLVGGQPLVLGEVTVTPAPTSHLASLRERLSAGYPNICFDAFAFALNGPKSRVVHSADIGAAEDLAPLLSLPVDLLTCELAHVELASLGAVLRGRELKQVVFIHLAREFWADRARTEALIRAELPGVPFHLARDGDEFRC
jgi:ribonuclease Z